MRATGSAVTLGLFATLTLGACGGRSDVLLASGAATDAGGARDGSPDATTPLDGAHPDGTVPSDGGLDGPRLDAPISDAPQSFDVLSSDETTVSPPPPFDAGFDAPPLLDSHFPEDTVVSVEAGSPDAGPEGGTLTVAEFSSEYDELVVESDAFFVAGNNFGEGTVSRLSREPGFQTLQTLADQLAFETGLTGGDPSVFWFFDQQPGEGGGRASFTIGSDQFDGGLGEASTYGTTSTFSGSLNAFAADATNLYLAGPSGIGVVPIGGAPEVKVLLPTAGTVTKIALDDDNVYFMEEHAPVPDGGDEEAGASAFTLQTIPKAGGTPRVLSLQIVDPLQIAVVGPNVYWIDAGTAAIDSCPIASGGRTIHQAGRTGIGGLAVDDTRLYWYEDSGVYEARFADDVAHRISRDEATALAIDDTNVYWLVTQRDGDANAFSTFIRTAPK